MTTVASLSLVPHLLIKPSFRCLSGKGVGRYGGIKVYAVLRDDSADYLKDNHWEALFHVDDPGPRVPIEKGKFLDAKQALDVVRFDIQYCDWRARQDLLTIMVLHNKVVEVLNPLARDFKSVGNLRKDLAGLQEDLAKAHNQLYLSESRVSSALDKLAQMETVVNERLLLDGSAFAATADCASLDPSTSFTPRVGPKKTKRRSLNISGPVKPYNNNLKNFWYPVAFSSDLKDDTMVPIDCFEEQWVIFRGKDKRPGCVQNTCAHRACPLDLGSVNEGRITCPYHGWEYSTDGKCEKMPSTKMLNVRIRALPCFEQEGMVWIWPGDDTPTPTIPSLLPPSGFTIHAEVKENDAIPSEAHVLFNLRIRSRPMQSITRACSYSSASHVSMPWRENKPGPPHAPIVVSSTSPPYLFLPPLLKCFSSPQSLADFSSASLSTGATAAQPLPSTLMPSTPRAIIALDVSMDAISTRQLAGAEVLRARRRRRCSGAQPVVDVVGPARGRRHPWWCYKASPPVLQGVAAAVMEGEVRRPSGGGGAAYAARLCCKWWSVELHALCGAAAKEGPRCYRLWTVVLLSVGGGATSEGHRCCERWSRVLHVMVSDASSVGRLSYQGKAAELQPPTD